MLAAIIAVLAVEGAIYAQFISLAIDSKVEFIEYS
tara:strand:+ start:2709 stop:2813 length:105 start_codon:yes stop_codon:yes gene_type:complete